MFEESIDTLKNHIEYLKGILEIDWSNSEDYDEIELRSRLNDCEDDINNIEFSMPYDEIDEDDIPIEDMSGENLEDGELEDEVVGVEALIKELRELMELANDRYLEWDGCGNLDNVRIQMKHSLSKEEFLSELLKLLREEIHQKISAKGPYLNEDEIERIAECIYFDAKCRADHKEAALLAEQENPNMRLTEDEIRINHLFSAGLNHIASGLIITYESLGTMMDFNSTLNFQKSIWGNLI